MAERKPTCGLQSPPTDSTMDVIITVLLFLLGIPGTIKGALEVIGLTEAFTLIVTAPVAVWIGAAAGAIATLTIIIVFWAERCAAKDGQQGCAAGVVNETEESFSSGWDTVFPFAAMHDRVDIVVKCIYWPILEAGAFIKCTSHSDPVDQSPILQSFFKSAKVCGAGLGSTIGGTAGAVGGIIAGALIGAAIGCATVILCILAIIIAVIVAVAAVLIGAFIGGNIGRAAADDTGPTADGTPIGVGNYVTARGNLLALGDFDGAIVFWFVEDADMHGSSREPGPPFTHRDPDANLIPDGCPTVVE